MTLIQLEQQFPGLFVTPVCQSLSDAERYADEVAAKNGLTNRSASQTSLSGVRSILYLNSPAWLALTVDMFPDTSRSRVPLFLFRFRAERLDVNLTVRSPHNARAKPKVFQCEVQAIIESLRTLKVSDDKRIPGRLKKWNQAKGIGFIECVPGASVLLMASDIAAGMAVGVQDWLSFKVEKTATRQRAVKVMKYDPLQSSPTYLEWPRI